MKKIQFFVLSLIAALAVIGCTVDAHDNLATVKLSVDPQPDPPAPQAVVFEVFAETKDGEMSLGEFTDYNKPFVNPVFEWDNEDQKDVFVRYDDLGTLRIYDATENNVKITITTKAGDVRNYTVPNAPKQTNYFISEGNYLKGVYLYDYHDGDDINGNYFIIKVTQGSGEKTK